MMQLNGLTLERALNELKEAEKEYRVKMLHPLKGERGRGTTRVVAVRDYELLVARFLDMYETPEADA